MFGSFVIAVAILSAGILSQVFNLDEDFHEVVGYVVMVMLCFVAFHHSSTLLCVS